MKENSGFTLIELMLVVAVVAILAAIAIPNYLKFVGKTRRAEVKYNLEAIFKAEVSWYSERNVFDSDFNTIRWKPVGAIYYYTFSLGAGTEGLSVAVNPMPAAAVPFANDNAFAAYGWGNIDSDATVDVWHIDERNNLVNDVDDLAS